MTHRTRHLLATAATATATIAAAALSVGAPAAAAHVTSWGVPHCHTVASDGSLTYTTNEGHTLRRTTGHMTPVRYQFSIAPLAAPGELLSADQSGRLFHSTDAGCSWTAGATLTGMDIPQLEAAPDGTAYAWSVNTNLLSRVTDGGTVTALPPLPTGGSSVVEVAVDPVDATHLRAVVDDGRVLESTNGGKTFGPIGSPPPGVYLYDASIDLNDLDHIVLGTLGSSVYTTFDGGTTWAAAQLGAAGDRANAFSVEISPASSRFVYVQGLDITEFDQGAPSQGRHIYRSRSGGRDFDAIVDQGAGVTLVNGALIVPHPTRPGTLYFVFGSNFGGYGTDLFRYRDRPGHAPDPLQVEHNPYDEIKSIAFNPQRPKVMYLGLADE